MKAGQFRDIVRSNANKRAESEAVLVACMQHVLYRTVRLDFGSSIMPMLSL